MTHPLINEHAAAWLNELRTTSRPKAKGMLISLDGCSCTLGDAMILEYGEPTPDGSNPNWVTHPFRKDRWVYNYDPSDDAADGEDVNIDTCLSYALARKLGLRTHGGGSSSKLDRRSIWMLNDNLDEDPDLTKAQIADIIEANAEAYFRPLEERA